MATKGTAFIKYTAEKTYEIYVQWGYEVSQLYKGARYIYEPTLKSVFIDGIQFKFIENVVFSF